MADLNGYTFLNSINTDTGSITPVCLAKDRHGNARAIKRVYLGEVEDGLGLYTMLIELDILTRIRHPHILYLHEFFSWQYDKSLFVDIVYPLAQHTLEEFPCCQVEQRFSLLKKVALGLSYLHELNILHGDIKPNNVLIIDGQPVIADFGLASYIPGKFMTTRYAVIFRPYEAIGHDVFPYNLWCDIWAFGILALWLFRGKSFPFLGTELEIKAWYSKLDKKKINKALYYGSRPVVDFVTWVLLKLPSMRDIAGHTVKAHVVYPVATPAVLCRAKIQRLLTACSVLFRKDREKTFLAMELLFRYADTSVSTSGRSSSADLTLMTILWIVEKLFSEVSDLQSIREAMQDKEFGIELLIQQESKIVQALGGVLNSNRLYDLCESVVHYDYILNNVYLAEDSSTYYKFTRIPLLHESIV